MRCIPTGKLRAWLDDELGAEERSQIVAHLQECSACRGRQQALSETSLLAQEHLAAMAPTRMPDPPRAMQVARSPVATASPRSSKRVDTPWNWRNAIMTNKTWRTVAIGAVVLALLVGTFSFAAPRALARQLLSVFRVKQFAVVQFDPNQPEMESLSAALEDSFFSQEPEVLVDEEPVTVASIEEARDAAGFEVRMPAYWPANGETTISVKGRTELGFAVEPEMLTMLFELVGMDPSLVPQDLGDGQVRGIIPSMVAITGEPYAVIQMLDPVIEYPEGLDPQILGQVGLRLLGLSPEEAERISASIDWATTLVLPVPAGQVSVTETVIAGEQAVIIEPAEHQGESVLVFQKGDVVYAVSGRAVNSRLAEIAESMF